MKFFQFFSNLLDKKLDNYPRITLALSRYFDVSSKITSVLLFNNFIFILFLFSCQLIINAYGPYFHYYFINIHSCGAQGIYSGFMILPGIVKLFIIFFIFLIQVVFFNTTLSLCPKIQNYMFTHYGPEILKQRGYNNPGHSVVRLGFACLACLSAYAGGEVSNQFAYKRQLDVYGQTYSVYVGAVGPNALPPQVPVYDPLASKASQVLQTGLNNMLK